MAAPLDPVEPSWARRSVAAPLALVKASHATRSRSTSAACSTSQAEALAEALATSLARSQYRADRNSSSAPYDIAAFRSFAGSLRDWIDHAAAALPY